MKCLDLFCGAGGCSLGYHQAGFQVIGVDIKKQPNYPFRFIQMDALEYLKLYGHNFDFIHASPPCQAFTVLKHCQGQQHLNLIPETRFLLDQLKVPYIIENVPGAPLITPILLCGTMFPELRVIRHRLFESNIPLKEKGICNHPPGGSLGKAAHHSNKVIGDWVSVAGAGDRLVIAHAMGLDPTHMTAKEQAQAIPPLYTKWLGEQVFSYLTMEKE